MKFAKFKCIDADIFTYSGLKLVPRTIELQWLDHLLDYGNVFEIGVIRATEGNS